MKNYKKKIIIYVIAFLVCGIIAYLLYNFLNNDTKTDKKESTLSEQNSISVSNDEQELFEDKLLGVEINDNFYVIELEDTEIAKDLLYMSPFKLNMEKEQKSLRGYLNNSLSGDGSYFSKASVGDVMLYNNNCLVIFLEDEELDDNYALIGRIANFGTINDNTIEVSFVR